MNVFSGLMSMCSMMNTQPFPLGPATTFGRKEEEEEEERKGKEKEEWEKKEKEEM